MHKCLPFFILMKWVGLRGPSACTRLFCGETCRRFRHSVLSGSQYSQCSYCPPVDPFHMTLLDCSNLCMDALSSLHSAITLFAIVRVGISGPRQVHLPIQMSRPSLAYWTFFYFEYSFPFGGFLEI